MPFARTKAHPSCATGEPAIRHTPKELHNAGRWRTATADATFAVYDPATGRTLCEVAGGPAALDAAHAVQADWATPPPGRAHGLLLERVEKPGPW
ncbi:hypothetical protein AABB02_05385 [Streptomyces rimosus]|uniref:hypothetical protein n=1 Tax=Streptomyces rimosus TaxID=1927 RepID=UPI0031D3FCD4